MRDRTFFILLFVTVGGFMAQDCVCNHMRTSTLREEIRKIYEKCEREGIPRQHCPI